MKRNVKTTILVAAACLSFAGATTYACQPNNFSFGMSLLGKNLSAPNNTILNLTAAPIDCGPHVMSAPTVSFNSGNYMRFSQITPRVVTYAADGKTIINNGTDSISYIENGSLWRKSLKDGGTRLAWSKYEYTRGDTTRSGKFLDVAAYVPNNYKDNWQYISEFVIWEITLKKGTKVIAKKTYLSTNGTTYWPRNEYATLGQYPVNMKRLDLDYSPETSGTYSSLRIYSITTDNRIFNGKEDITNKLGLPLNIIGVDSEVDKEYPSDNGYKFVALYDIAVGQKCPRVAFQLDPYTQPIIVLARVQNLKTKAYYNVIVKYGTCRKLTGEMILLPATAKIGDNSSVGFTQERGYALCDQNGKLFLNSGYSTKFNYYDRWNPNLKTPKDCWITDTKYKYYDINTIH